MFVHNVCPTSFVENCDYKIEITPNYELLFVEELVAMNFSIEQYSRQANDIARIYVTHFIRLIRVVHGNDDNARCCFLQFQNGLFLNLFPNFY
jgi:hypothetical protein